MISKILKESEEFKSVLSDIKSEKQAHTYLFVSPDKFTAKEMSRLVANALLCKDLCGKCENCVKFQGEHPDVKYFPKKKDLLVEDSNYIVDESFVKPIFSDRKIFIIDDFDQSTQAAQNKLLKVLEEPNENMYYLLSTSNIENVLPTIRSRCFKVEIGKFDEKEIEGCMVGVFGNQRHIAVAVGGGYLGKTLDLVKRFDLEEIFSIALETLTKLKTSKEVLIYSKKILDKKDDISLVFEMISLILEDMLAIKIKKSNLLKLKFVESEIKAVLDDYSVKAIAEIEKLMTNVMQELKYNTNMTIVIDNFLMSLLEVKYLCR